MSKALRFLILEDQPADAELVTRELRKAGFDFVATTVTTEKEYLAELRASAPHLILADYSLPGYDGLSALAAAQKQCPQTPFVFVSGSMGEEKAIETLHLGATDYVLKQRLKRLGPAVRRALREGEGMGKREQAEQERQQAQESLRESERRYRLLFNSGHDAVFVHQGGSAGNDSGKFIEVNDVACQRLGYTREELLQMTPQDISAPETLRDIPGIRATLAARTTAVSEGVHVAKDGRRIPVEISTHVFELNGKPTRLSLVRDLVEHKRAEVRLHLLSEALESAANAIVITDRDGIITWANAEFTRLSGYPVEEALGRKLSILKSGAHDLAFYQNLWETILAGRVWSSEMINRRKDGSLYTEENTITPVRNEWGEITHFITVKQNITGRKRAESRIAAFANLGQRLNAVKTTREAAKIIVQVADELLGWDACLFDLYSATENRLSHLLSMDLIDGRRAECKPLDPHGPPTELGRRAIEEGGQLILRDHLDAVRPEDVPFGDTSRPSASILFVPIRHGTEVLGVLSIQSYTPGAYDASSLEVLQALADYGGGALERLRAEEALSESEANFRSVWERSIDGMRLADKEGRILAVNEAFCQLVKLPREKLEGQIFSVAYKGHGPNDGVETYQKRFATGDIVPRDTPRAQLSNSDEVDLEISNSFIELGQRGKMLLSIVRDVSERKRAELRIEAFSNLGKRLSAAKTAREAAGIISEVADELLGWDACLFSLLSPDRDLLDHVLELDTIEGRRVESSPGSEPPSAMARHAIETGGQLVLKESPDQMLPGSQPFGDLARPSASIMYVPVRKGTEVIGVMSIQSYAPGAYDPRSLETLQALADHCGGAFDRLRLEEALQRERHRAQRYLDVAEVMIVAIDPSQSVLLANRKTCEILACEESDLVGNNWFDAAVPKEGRDNLKAGFSDLMAGKIASEKYAEGLVLTGRGEKRLIAWHNTVLRDETGRIIAMLSSGEDITERKALEERLRQSQKMEAVGQLAGGVAHDFNNMLAVIQGNAELLLMDETEHTAGTREGLKHVVEASQRAANLTRQLLAFSRKQVLQPQPLLLNEVIANLTKMLNRVIRENIDLQCHYAAALPYVQADTGMIEQVILNLVVNARDAMPRGGQLRVATEQLRLDEAHARTHPEARAGEFVCLLVSDTGVGIAPEVLPRIFEPFFTTKEVGKGTGLGLATVYGVVQQHQGWIEVSSQVGKGSTFKIVLPAIPPPAQPPAASAASAGVPGGTETILLVEDEHGVRMATRRVLESKGYKIREAANAREALAVWQSHAGEIALLLTDIIMPEEMTGRDLAAQLWRQRPGLRVIFMSGYSAEVIGKNAEFIQRTKSHFVQKPCSSRILLETVRRCLDEKAPGAAAGDDVHAK
jgi:PAS domain S-box-containing protein